jgi:hypothetical protein
MTPTTTAPQRGVLASFAFLLISMLSAQALALDIDGLSYEWIIFEADLKLTGYACCAGGDLYMPPLVVPEDNTYIAAISTIAEKAFFATGVTSVTVVASVTNIESGAFANNTLTSAAFKGDFGTFSADMFDGNPNLATITYCLGKTGWPQDFDNGSITIATTPIICPPLVGATPLTATPVPVGPLWLLGMMAGLLSLVGIRKLRKA